MFFSIPSPRSIHCGSIHTASFALPLRFQLRFQLCECVKDSDDFLLDSRGWGFGIWQYLNHEHAERHLPFCVMNFRLNTF